MRRIGILAAAVVVVAVSAATVDAATPHARVRGFVCQHALDPPARAISITSVMTPLTGTKKMQVRVLMLTRTNASRPYSTISGGDLGTWITPADPTLGQRHGDVWILHKQVVDLAAPAAYRFRVFFRWIGAHDRLLGTAERESPICSQPELRPDLLVQSIAVQPVANHPPLNRYVATIRNAGATAAGPFEILFTPGTLAVETKDVNGLAPYARVQESFLGPACSSDSATTVTVDPNDQVDDFNRTNNSMTAVC
jgi:hypothetical protein